MLARTPYFRGITRESGTAGESEIIRESKIKSESRIKSESEIKVKLKASPKGHCNGISSKGRHQSETGVNGAVSWEMFGKYPGNICLKIFHLFHFPTPCCPGNSPETEIKYRTIKTGH